MTAAAHSDDQRRRELAAIHTARKQLGLDDDAYRDFIAGLTGKRSAGDLNEQQRRLVIDELRRLGFSKQYAPSPKDKNFVYHARVEHRLIAALWRNLWLLGEIEDAGPRALDHFVQRQAGVAALKWLAPEAAHSVVQALKDWLGRAGFDTPGQQSGRGSGRSKASPEASAASVKKLALQRLVRAQWARLEAAGALSFGAEAGAELTGEAKLLHEARVRQHRADALDRYFDRYAATCSKGIGHAMTTPAELAKCAERLAAWLRAARAKQRELGGESPDAGASGDSP